MAKEAYYFSHDANARQDEKILMLRAEHSWEGYGIYWALIEMMFESSDSALHHNKIKGIAVSYNIDITLLQHVINTCITEELFTSDNEKFWSESLSRRKSKFLDSKEKKSEAGKKGMAKRYGKQQSNNTVITVPNKVKESKEKEIKVNEIKVNDKESKEEEPQATLTTIYNAYRLYESEKFGIISSTIGDKIGHMIDDYTEIWVCKALEEAVYYGKRYLPYVKTILEDWTLKNHPEPWTLEREVIPQKNNVRHFNRGGNSGKQHIPIIADSPRSEPISEEKRNEMLERIMILDDQRASPDEAS